MDLERGDGESRETISVEKHLVTALSWETKDEMRPDKDASCVRALNRVNARLKSVSPLYTLQATL